MDYEGAWHYSVPVEAQQAAATGAFTSLPIRIHRRNDIADKATIQSMMDWEEHVRDGWELKSGSAMSPVGNWGSFIFPEAKEERLYSITYLASIGNIHDDACEELSLEDAIKDHQDFSKVLDPGETHPLSAAESKSIQMKALASKCMLDILSLDHDLGLRMLESYRKKWLDVMEHPDYEKVQALETYLEFRMLNGGMEPFWLMCEFGMGYNFHPEQRQLFRNVFEPAESALVLTNDYWSWDREYHASLTTGARIVNSVDLISRTKKKSIEEALEIVRAMIIENEREYVRRRDALFAEHPNLSGSVKGFVNVCGLVVAGNHYWCANCPRHHAWRNQKEVNSRILQSIKDDVGLKVGENTNPELESSSNSSTTSVASCDNTDLKSNSDTTSCSESCKRQSSHSSQTSVEDLTSISSKEKRPKLHHPVDMPCEYIASLPSKGVRNLLIDALNQWFQIPNARVETIKQVTSKLHNASLVLDDIQDGSTMRRGKPAAHVIFGAAQSINSATYLFVQAVQLIHGFADSETETRFLQFLQDLHHGQGYDLYWKFAMQCPSQAEYLAMVDQKTGAMFEMLILLMQSQSPAVQTSFSQFTELFGRFFQVRDDYMNINSSTYNDQKGFCEDLDEGKLSFLIVMCNEQRPDLAEQISNLFRTRSSPKLAMEVKLYIISLLKMSKAMENTLKWLQLIEMELEREVARLEQAFGKSNSMLRLVLQTLSMKGA